MSAKAEDATNKIIDRTSLNWVKQTFECFTESVGERLMVAGLGPKTNFRTLERSGRMSHKQGAKRFLRFAEYGLAFDLASERLLQE
jgi:hypothetical protein